MDILLESLIKKKTSLNTKKNGYLHIYMLKCCAKSANEQNIKTEIIGIGRKNSVCS